MFSIANHILGSAPNKGRLRSACVIPFFVLLALSLENCGRDRRHDRNKVPLPIALVRSSDGFGLDDGGGLNLVSTGTNLVISISGCSSGNTVGAVNVSTSTVILYSGDQTCLVKLLSFKLGTTTYSATAAGATNFTTWLNNNTATFANISLSTDTIKVFVTSQVTQGGVTGSDSIVYSFTDIATGTAKSLSQSAVSNGVTLPSLTSITTPNFTIQQTNYLGITTAGNLKFAFTLACASTVTGSSLATYACGSYVMQSQIDYIFIPDIYSQGAITYAQADIAFQYNVATTTGNLIAAAGGTDTSGNTITNGGFYTSTTSPLTTLLFPGSNTNYVLILRGKDINGSILGYQYFYVNVAMNNSF